MAAQQPVLRMHNTTNIYDTKCLLTCQWANIVTIDQMTKLHKGLDRGAQHTKTEFRSVQHGVRVQDLDEATMATKRASIVDCNSAEQYKHEVFFCTNRPIFWHKQTKLQRLKHKGRRRPYPCLKPKKHGCQLEHVRNEMR